MHLTVFLQKLEQNIQANKLMFPPYYQVLLSHLLLEELLEAHGGIPSVLWEVFTYSTILSKMAEAPTFRQILCLMINIL